MYIPKFSITNPILKSIGAIEAAREIIDNAPLIPAYEKQFRDDAILRTVYHGTHVEGNDLTFSQAKRVLEGEEVTARERDIQEIINYRRVVDFIEELSTRIDRPLIYTLELLERIHQLTVDKIIPETQAGRLRTSQVVVKDAATGEVTFRPPPSIEVPFLLEGFFEWLNSSVGKEVHPVLRAGISHYILVAIHPFVEGNGRTSRAFTTLVLFNEGYDIKRLFSLEEYYDKDSAAYYEALIKVSSQSLRPEERDLTYWLEYFTKGLATELEKIKEEVKKLSLDSRMKDRVGRQIALSERQIKLMEYLNRHSSIKMVQAKTILPMVSEDTILRDLLDLMRKGIIKKKGRTKGAEYILR